VSADSVALEHYRDRRDLVEAAAGVAEDAWRSVSTDDLIGSWRESSATVLVAVSGAQLAAAQDADGYLSAVLGEQDIDPASDGQVNPRPLAGIASDGRSLSTLLEQPMIATLVAIGDGAAVPSALATGYATLDMIVRTQVADAGRTADQIALTARPQAPGYVRMVVGRTCSRCVVLAGRWYRYDAGFNRHPRCDCVGVPAAEDTSGDIRTNPRAYFDSLSRAEQDQAFTKAGAQAIRDGADIAKTVNARRGMYTPADGRKYTTEAAGRRPRLLPEQIYLEANGDRAEAVRLLRLHGYIR
jgi:hypothetical protein